MAAEWLSKPGDISGRANSALGNALQALNSAVCQRRIRVCLIVLFALWASVALARLLWGLVPASERDFDNGVPVLNPSLQAASAADAEPVDVQRMVSWHLFGELGAGNAIAEPETPAEAREREGIEKGARESRLELSLRGVVASTDDGLGHAIIEYRNRQAVYAVGDKMPVSGQVELAKVLPRQVVLDNNGTYELLTLFEDSALDSQLPARENASPAVDPEAGVRKVERRDDATTTTLARGFRERLYKDPQSLAEVVNIVAVRENGALLGYRVSPGNQRQQFEQLGFRKGDIVTRINGLALDNPANTMRLYQMMRTASEAVFDLQRGDEALSVSVALENRGPG